MKKFSMDDMTNYCNQYGFIFQGSEIYGGLANTWDYGPLGSQLKNQIKEEWRNYFIRKRENSYELDCDILMNPSIWKASGHLESFTDPLLDCRECKTRHRADQFISDYDPSVNADTMTQEEMSKYIKENQIPCPKCGKSNLTDIRQFNLMFATHRGATQTKTSDIYLRPENAQGEYVNYMNVVRTMRTKLPFSIGQIGKAFRNEITPGNFTFRTIEFEQMEFQTFCKKDSDESQYAFYKQYGISFFESLGLQKDHLRFHDHDKLAHYAKSACDIEYLFPFGWGEINGTHNRTDFDLRSHQKYSGKNMAFYDEQTKEKHIPYIIESTYGLDRIFLAILFDSLTEETLDGKDTRLVLKIHPKLAPYKVNVLPLVKKKHSEKAYEIYQMLKECFYSNYDDAGNIGKRYRRGDAIGTPYTVTVDDNTLLEDTITIRNRDTMDQIRIPLHRLINYINESLAASKEKS